MIFRTKLFLLFVFFISSFTLQAQLSMQELSKMKVDQLTDQQIVDVIAKYKSAGYGIEQVEQSLLQNGMSATEWSKLKRRIETVENSREKTDYLQPEMSRTGTAEKTEVRQDIVDEKATEAQQQIPIFGSSLFNSRNLTFEPNLRLPTPDDYQLGVDDELIIDVYGYSENTMRAKVSPEGFIRIPSVGQIQVNGLRMDQATKIITNKLSSIYTTIGSGTSVNIALGNIRSIKVVMIGEVIRPGTYTLPSVATVFNALNAAGGPNQNGSFRKIKVIRNNKLITEVDIYDFLLTGELKNNVRLQDQDVIKVEPYQKRIELIGEVKNTGYFEAIGDEKLADLITFAGGFTNNAYKDQITVLRNTPKEKSVADITSGQFNIFILQDGDVYNVSKLLDRFTNRVQIEGAVFRPGTYALEDGMRLMQLIEKADGLREDAFMDRAIITREKEDLTTEVIAFNLNSLLKGTGSDFLLRKEDKVEIASLLEMKEKQKVVIYGEVKNEGEYTYHEKMTLKDLIFLAGGFKEKAEISKVEVSRIVMDRDVLRNGKETSHLFSFSVDRNLEFADGANEFTLEPHDQIIVRQLSGFSTAKKVMLEGEVYYPGPYIISSKSDKISDLIKRAGGFNAYAYPEGAFLIRQTGTSIAEEKLESEIFAGTSAGDTTINREKFFKKEGIVGINLDQIMKNPSSKWDLLLEEGDIISVPRMLQTVQVTGEVLLPAHVRYDASNSFLSYIGNSGGFSNNALKRKTFIVHANGTAETTKRVFFIRKYPDVTPGAKIYVPQKPERRRMSTGEILSIGTATVSLATMITLLVTQLNKSSN